VPVEMKYCDNGNRILWNGILWTSISVDAGYEYNVANSEIIIMGRFTGFLEFTPADRFEIGFDDREVYAKPADFETEIFRGSISARAWLEQEV